ncbi:MAG: flavin reductase [Campylobacterota bacterium]|nr:flavin reductase [Campylobacterota bacterium]
MLFDYRDTKTTENYQLMAQSIIPRPIAWVVTENRGVVNIAPFSYFIGLSSSPATLLISIGHKKDGSPKDTLRNLREDGKCTICMVERPQLEAMHLSSKELDSAISEAKHFDIETTALIEGFPPMVSGSANAFFCDFHQEIELKGSKTIPLVVEIKHQFVDDRCIVDVEKMTLQFEPVARIGKSYAMLGEEVVAPKIP